MANCWNCGKSAANFVALAGVKFCDASCVQAYEHWLLAPRVRGVRLTNVRPTRGVPRSTTR